MTTGDKDKTGFGAFDDLVSDVSKEVEAPAQKSPPASEPVKPTNTSAQEDSSHPQQPQQPKSAAIPQNTSGGGQGGTPWGWIAFGVFVVFVLIAGSGGEKVEVPSTPAYQEPYTSPNVEAAAPAAEPAAPAIEPTPAPRDPLNPEEMPPTGKGLVLTQNQIRYCLSMDVRLSTIKEALDTYSQTEVDNFNSAIEDYNSRCSNFRYRTGLLESIRSEVISNHPTLVTEGLRILESWRGKASEPVSELQMPVPIKTASSKNSRPIGREQQLPTQNYAPTNPVEIPPPNGLNSLSSDEKSSLEAACSHDKYSNGPAAYNNCVANQLSMMSGAPARPNLSGLSSDEESSLEAACSHDKYSNGPAAYNNCLNNQIAKMARAPLRPNLSGLSSDEKSSLEAACSHDKYSNGPAAYNNCIANQLSMMANAARPNLSLMSAAERAIADAACSHDKYSNGPAAYNSCMQNYISSSR